jgi:hypothetical protein
MNPPPIGSPSILGAEMGRKSAVSAILPSGGSATAKDMFNQ